MLDNEVTQKTETEETSSKQVRETVTIMSVTLLKNYALSKYSIT